jgi:hypothetical protein
MLLNEVDCVVSAGGSQKVVLQKLIVDLCILEGFQIVDFELVGVMMMMVVVMF